MTLLDGLKFFGILINVISFFGCSLAELLLEAGRWGGPSELGKFKITTDSQQKVYYAILSLYISSYSQNIVISLWYSIIPLIFCIYLCYNIVFYEFKLRQVNSKLISILVVGANVLYNGSPALIEKVENDDWYFKYYDSKFTTWRTSHHSRDVLLCYIFNGMLKEK